MDRDTITVVSGLPRSGTSMMMKMLAAGGMEIVTDGIRSADDDNPEGYYELERVKKLEADNSWVGEARGRVVKVISALLKHLPGEYRYKVLFIHRRMAEILASQQQMLVRRGQAADPSSDPKMTEVFQRHLQRVEEWLGQQRNMDVLYVHYNEILERPAEHVERINRFLGGTLDAERMTSVINKALHRQRV